MKTYKKGNFFYLDFPEEVREEQNNEFELILKEISSLKAYSIVLNLANVNYLSSLTIRIIIRYHKALSSQKTAMHIINVSKIILEQFEFTNLSKILKIYPSEQDLMDALNTSDLINEVNDGAEFSYAIKNIGNHANVYMAGIITSVADLNSFETAILEYAEKDKRNFIFDLKEIKFIDSMGVGKFIKIYNKLAQQDLKVVFCNLNEVTTDFFKIFSLKDKFTILSTIEEAKAYVN